MIHFENDFSSNCSSARLGAAVLLAPLLVELDSESTTGPLLELAKDLCLDWRLHEAAYSSEVAVETMLVVLAVLAVTSPYRLTGDRRGHSFQTDFEERTSLMGFDSEGLPVLPCSSSLRCFQELVETACVWMNL